MNPILDKIGQEIKPGSIIAYGHALGRCAGLRIFKVLSIARAGTNYDGKPAYRLKARGVDDSYGRSRLTPKDVLLQYPDRCVVIPDENLSPPYQMLLDSIQVEAVKE